MKNVQTHKFLHQSPIRYLYSFDHEDFTFVCCQNWEDNIYIGYLNAYKFTTQKTISINKCVSFMQHSKDKLLIAFDDGFIGKICLQNLSSREFQWMNIKLKNRIVFADEHKDVSIILDSKLNLWKINSDGQSSKIKLTEHIKIYKVTSKLFSYLLVIEHYHLCALSQGGLLKLFQQDYLKKSLETVQQQSSFRGRITDAQYNKNENLIVCTNDKDEIEIYKIFKEKKSLNYTIILNTIVKIDDHRILGISLKSTGSACLAVATDKRIVMYDLGKREKKHCTLSQKESSLIRKVAWTETNGVLMCPWSSKIPKFYQISTNQ